MGLARTSDHAQHSSLALSCLRSFSWWLITMTVSTQLEYFACVWINSIPGPVLGMTPRDVILWLFVSGLVGHNKIYESCCRIAITHSEHRIMPLGLPFLNSTLGNALLLCAWAVGLTKATDHLNTNRERAIQAMIDSLYLTADLLVRFEQSGSIVSRASPVQSCPSCTAMKLGVLMRGIQALALRPKPQTPFSGLSFSGIRESIKSIRGITLTFPNHARCRALQDMITNLNNTSWRRIEDSIEAEKFDTCCPVAWGEEMFDV